MLQKLRFTIIALFSVVILLEFHFLKEPQSQTELIKAQLKAMVAEDQQLRSQIDQANFNPDVHQKDAELKAKIRAVDAKNTAALKEILQGLDKKWVTLSEFGQEADKDAWLLVQHADQDRQFQKEILARLYELCAQHETNAQNVAYLYDRLAVAEVRPQKYGTQFAVKDGTLVFNEIEDPINIDARRKHMGLSTFKEYELMVLEALKLAPNSKE